MIEIGFNLLFEITLCIILSKKMNWIGNRFQSESDQKLNRLQFCMKNSSQSKHKIEIAFNFI